MTRNQDTWQPKYPDAAETAGAMQGDDGTFRSFDWTDAPADSHVKQFRFVAASKMGMVLARLNQFQSFLYVIFKATEKAPETEYRYRFPIEREGQAVFDRMVGHPDPWEVGDAMLVKPGVKYTKLR